MYTSELGEKVSACCGIFWTLEVVEEGFGLHSLP